MNKSSIANRLRIFLLGGAAVFLPAGITSAQELLPRVQESNEQNSGVVASSERHTPPIVDSSQFLQPKTELYPAKKIELGNKIGDHDSTEAATVKNAGGQVATTPAPASTIQLANHLQQNQHSTSPNQGVQIFPGNGSNAIAPSMQTFGPAIPSTRRNDFSNAGFQDSPSSMPAPRIVGPGQVQHGMSGGGEIMPSPDSYSNNSFQHAPGKIAPYSQYETAPGANYFDGSQGQPYQNMGQPYQDMGQGAYGYDDGYGGGYGNGGPMDGRSINCCGFISDSCTYLISEGLLWEREDGVIRGANLFGFDDFDETLGLRFTYGRRYDEMTGWEISAFGFDAMLANTTRRDPTGTITGNLFGTPGGGFNTDAFFTSFRGVQYFDQVQNTNLYNVESNWCWFGWDVAKFFYGFRYINFDDDLRISTQANARAPEFGLYTMDLNNHLFGGHIGGELFYDVGYRLSFSFRGKLGAYINFVEGDTLFINNGTVNLANGDDTTDIAYSYEFGIFAHYQLMPRVRLTGGYEFFGLGDVATIEGNFNRAITPLTGTNYNTGDDALFHGFSVGLEIYR